MRDRFRAVAWMSASLWSPVWLFSMLSLVSLLWGGTAWASPGAPDRTLPWVTPAVSAPGVVFRTSRIVGAPVSYHAYVPRAHGQPDQRLPVLYWLHGTGGGVAGIAPLARLFDDAIESGRIPAMIVVFVNGLPRRLWADSKNGASPVETVFVSEVIPDVDQHFRTLATREGRLLEGFSMGGYGAARIGFKHPQLFAGISILAGGPFDLELRGPRAQRNPGLRDELLREVCSDDPEYFKAISPWMIAASAAPHLASHRTLIRHAIGTRDDTLGLNRAFSARMRELQIEHDYIEIADTGHDAQRVLLRLLDSDAGFYRRAFASVFKRP
jgi:enterochelin esterase-like enzyme